MEESHPSLVSYGVRLPVNRKIGCRCLLSHHPFQRTLWAGHTLSQSGKLKMTCGRSYPLPCNFHVAGRVGRVRQLRDETPGQLSICPTGVEKVSLPKGALPNYRRGDENLVPHFVTAIFISQEGLRKCPTNIVVFTLQETLRDSTTQNSSYAENR